MNRESSVQQISFSLPGYFNAINASIQASETVSISQQFDARSSNSGPVHLFGPNSHFHDGPCDLRVNCVKGFGNPGLSNDGAFNKCSALLTLYPAQINDAPVDWVAKCGLGDENKTLRDEIWKRITDFIGPQPSSQMLDLSGIESTSASNGAQTILPPLPPGPRGIDLSKSTALIRSGQIPSDFSKRFPDLHVLKLASLDITELPSSLDSLDTAFPNLEEFNIDDNHLEMLPHFLPKSLKVLSAANNNLICLPAGIPSSLRDLNVEGNNMDALFLEPELPLRPFHIHFQNLISLNLSNTSINHLPTILPPLLETLKCDSMGLKSLPGTIASLKNLKVLSCAHNWLTTFAPATPLPRALQKVNVTGNAIAPSELRVGGPGLPLPVGCAVDDGGGIISVRRGSLSSKKAPADFRAKLWSLIAADAKSSGSSHDPLPGWICNSNSARETVWSIIIAWLVKGETAAPLDFSIIAKIGELPDLPPTVKTLSLKSCGLLSFPKNFNLAFPNLVKIDLSGNPDLVELPDRLPIYLTDIIAHSCGSVKYIPSTWFDAISELQLPAKPILKLVDLSDCLLLRDFSNITSWPSSLQTLLIMGTSIEEIPKNLPSTLLQLRCGRSVSLKSLDGLNSLKKLTLLSCSDCENLVSLPEDLPPVLEELDCDGCSQMNVLPYGVGDLPFLKTIRANRCALLELPDTIVACSQLEALYASSNKLATLPMLANCRKLERLDVSHNNIFSLLSLPLSLRELDVRGNESMANNIPSAKLPSLLRLFKCDESVARGWLLQSAGTNRLDVMTAAVAQLLRGGVIPRKVGSFSDPTSPVSPGAQTSTESEVGPPSPYAISLIDRALVIAAGYPQLDSLRFLLENGANCLATDTHDPHHQQTTQPAAKASNASSVIKTGVTSSSTAALASGTASSENVSGTGGAMSGISAIYRAIVAGQANAVALLIEWGLKKIKEEEEEEKVKTGSVSSRNPLQVLLETHSPSGLNALHAALCAKQIHPKIIESLVKTGMNLNLTVIATENKSQHAHHQPAATSPIASFVQAAKSVGHAAKAFGGGTQGALSNPASPGLAASGAHMDFGGLTALQIAATFSTPAHATAAGLLLEDGADMSIVDGHGRTALAIAMCSAGLGAGDMVTHFVKNGALPSQSNVIRTIGIRPLAIKALVAAADTAQEDALIVSATTPSPPVLSTLASTGQADAVAALVESNIGPELVNYQNPADSMRTPVFAAITAPSNAVRIIEILAKGEADMNVVDSTTGMSVLEIAIKAAASITGAAKELQRNKALAIVSALVKAGAKITEACTLAAAPLDAAGKNALMRRPAVL